MSFSLADLAKLRWHLMALIGALATASITCWWSWQLHEGADRMAAQAKARSAQTEARLDRIKSEEEEIRSKTALYLRLQQGGLIGDERRLDWAELLAAQQKALRLPTLNYEFEAQTPLDPPDTPGARFFKSQMKLHLHLLHEGDLLHIIDILEHQAPALVVTRSCKLARLAANATEREGSLAQLNADCELDWITLRPQGGRS